MSSAGSPCRQSALLLVAQGGRHPVSARAVSRASTSAGWWSRSLVVIAQLWVRSHRAGPILLSAVGSPAHIGTRDAPCGRITAGYLGNAVLPARLGEVDADRADLAGARRVTATAATASVVIERVVDLLALARDRGGRLRRRSERSGGCRSPAMLALLGAFGRRAAAPRRWLASSGACEAAGTGRATCSIRLPAGLPRDGPARRRRVAWLAEPAGMADATRIDGLALRAAPSGIAISPGRPPVLIAAGACRWAPPCRRRRLPSGTYELGADDDGGARWGCRRTRRCRSRCCPTRSASS